MLILEANTQVSDWLLFFGRFHPLVVHLPIGFLFAVITLELLKLYDKITVNQEVIKILLLVSAISSAFSCLVGYFLSLDGGYNEELLIEHRNQGIFLAILASFAWIMKIEWFSRKLSRFNVLYYPTLILTLFVLFITGHHGGNLTHGETYLTENTPQPFRGWFGIPDKEEKSDNTDLPKIQNINEALVYQALIRPIFKRKCEQCHNASKMKGDLRMDTIEFLKKGGEHGNIFVEGKSDESELIKRILLPESNDDHMPPKGKNQIIENELKLLKWWIDNGASFDKKTADLPQNDEIKSVLAIFGGGIAAAENKQNLIKQDNFELEAKILSQKVDGLSDATKNEIQKIGGLILPFSKENNYVEVSFVNKSSLKDVELKPLLNADKQILWLRLSNTQITDLALKDITKLSKITRLHVENTKISDAGLSEIIKLGNLEYLNLVGTKISDSGLKTLASFKNLKKIYLWKTSVTEAGINELQKNLPNLVIDKGISENEIKDFLSTKPNEVSDDVYQEKKVVQDNKKVKK